MHTWKCVLYLTVLLLVAVLPANISVGEKTLQPICMTLASYDILDRSLGDTSVWLRFKVEYNTDCFLIDRIELDYHGPHEEDCIGSDVVLSQSDPAIYEYIFGHILIEKTVDDDYVKELMTEGCFEGYVVLRDKRNDEFYTSDCMVNSKNAIMGTDYTPDAYKVEVNQYEYEKIEEPTIFYSSYQGMKEYVESHPDIECYKITLWGRECIGASGQAILFPKFTSSSSGLFLHMNGVIYETAAEASDAFDLLFEGQKDIHFIGVICVENSELIRDKIRNAEMYISFSTEFAGTFDMSDAGDRFDGPKAVTLPITVSDNLTEN